MVELQIVVLAVAGSSPVGHPDHSSIPTADFRVRRAVAEVGGMRVAKELFMPQIDFFGDSEFRATPPPFWQRIINDEALADCDDLAKLIAGCELIAALDDFELLAA